jgi:hypothetical protein
MRLDFAEVIMNKKPFTFVLLLIWISLTGAMSVPAHDLRRTVTPGETDEASGELVVPEPIARVVRTSLAGVCAGRLAAFDRIGGQVSVTCGGKYLEITTRSGLPPAPATADDRIMVGIKAWIQRVPLPFTYHWRIPLAPDWLPSPQAASPRGPIAVAIDGVPIFHLDKRPDANTDPANYNPKHDTVRGGELDQCGGHAGQGDDYHYHYTPVCLVEKRALDKPIAFGLDGVPIYFGTGGNDYFGRGRVSRINNLPRGRLDECNAVRRSDGSYVHFTTKQPPYIIGCHHARVDRRLAIEPRPLRGRDQRRASPLGRGQLGEPVRTLITNYYVDKTGWHHLEFKALAGTGTGAVLYRRSNRVGDCWDFEHRPDMRRAEKKQTVCR